MLSTSVFSDIPSVCQPEPHRHAGHLEAIKSHAGGRLELRSAVWEQAVWEGRGLGSHEGERGHGQGLQTLGPPYTGRKSFQILP